jgi:hypothetical protein
MEQLEHLGDPAVLGSGLELAACGGGGFAGQGAG